MLPSNVDILTKIGKEGWVIHKGKAVDVTLIVEVVSVVAGEDLYCHLLIIHCSFPH
jgi:hypothetical protein